MRALFLGLGLIAAAPSVGAAQSDTLATFETRLVELFEREHLTGLAAGIVQGQELIWSKGFGYADLESGKPVTPTTLFRLASVSKPFAAVILMQLVEEGRLRLEAPMADLPVGKRYREQPILVRHVLTHTSEGTPGDAYKYNGNIFGDLTLVIEKTTGRSYVTELEERIFGRVGMDRSVPGQLAPGYDEVMRDFAKPYVFEKGKAVSTPHRLWDANWTVDGEQDWNDLAQGPSPDLGRRRLLGDAYTPLYGVNTAAGIVSSIVDLAKFDAALDRNELVSAVSKDLMFTPAVSNAGRVLPYGLGWFVETVRGVKVVWHYGWYPPTVSALYVKVPEKDVTLLLLANTDQLSAGRSWTARGVVASPYAQLFLYTFVSDR